MLLQEKLFPQFIKSLQPSEGSRTENPVIEKCCARAHAPLRTATHCIYLRWIIKTQENDACIFMSSFSVTILLHWSISLRISFNSLFHRASSKNTFHLSDKRSYFITTHTCTNFSSHLACRAWDLSGNDRGNPDLEYIPVIPLHERETATDAGI